MFATMTCRNTAPHLSSEIRLRSADAAAHADSPASNVSAKTTEGEMPKADSYEWSGGGKGHALAEHEMHRGRPRQDTYREHGEAQKTQTSIMSAAII